VTGAFGTAGVEVHHTRHFLDDARRLPEVLVRKVDEAVIKIRSQGIYQSGLLAEKVHGNPDGRFRFLRVDLQYRMVAVAEGRDIMLMKVGNHDETDRWGTTATLSGELLGGKQVRLVDHDHHPPVALGLLRLEQLGGLGITSALWKRGLPPRARTTKPRSQGRAYDVGDGVPARTEAMPVLIVDDDRSYCGECGRGAFLKEKRHLTVAWPDELGAAGCGVAWTELATHLRSVPYRPGIPADDFVRAVRPDLRYIGVIPWDWRTSGHDA
jgi:hypothetical protein